MKNIKILWVYIEIGYTKLLQLFNIKRSIVPIPKGTPYCYDWDDNQNEKELIDGYSIKPCKYYRGKKGKKVACIYVGYIGYDSSLEDQCKICGVDYEYVKDTKN